MAKEPLRIFIADDHRVLRQGLRLLLESQECFRVVGEASNGAEVLAELPARKAEILLLDLSMPKMGGMDCLRALKEQKSTVKVLILSMYSEQQYIKEVMQLGACGFINKNALDEELFEALRTVAAGRRYLGKREEDLLLDSFLEEGQDEKINLSEREKEVLDLLVHGYSLSVIADQLYLSVKTVSTYKTRLMMKLGCTQKSELVDYALKHQILRESEHVL